MKKKFSVYPNPAFLCLILAILLYPVSNAYAASIPQDPILQASNIDISQGQVHDLTSSVNPDSIFGLEQGTIVIRYLSASSQTYQSLFSVSNATSGNQDRHFHLYITPDGTLGMELRNTDSIFKYTMSAERAVTPGVNTIAFTADKTAGTYRLYSNGSLVAKMEKGDFKFFSDITGLDTISLGGTVRDGAVKYPFGGTIFQAEVYQGPMSEVELLEKTAMPVSMDLGDITISEGSVYDLTTNPVASGILSMNEGTIFISYTSTSQEEYQSLFSVSNSTFMNEDRHFHLYVTSDGTLGMELRNTDGEFKYTLSDRRAVKTEHLSQLAKNTVALKADASAGVYKLFANGRLVGTLQPDTYYFLSDIMGINTISLGGTVRNGKVDYPFGGTIHQVKVTDRVLSDEELCNLTKETYYGGKIFYPGDATNANYFRIPSLLTLESGTVAAAADARYGGTYDAKSNIDIAFARSTDGGQTWSEPSLPLCFDDYAAQRIDWPNGLVSKKLRISGSASFIDPLLVQDRDTGRLFLFADAMPAGIGSSNASVGNGYKTIDGTQYLKLRWHQDNNNAYNYTVRENGIIYDDLTNTPTEYSINERFEILKNGTPMTVKQYEVSINGLSLSENRTNIDVAMNVFYKDSLFQVFPTAYLAMTYSDDEGQTWSAMQLLNTLKDENEKLLITGPGVGIQIKQGNFAGRIIIPVYSVTQAGFGVLYSDNSGLDWSYSAADTTSSGATAEGQLLELPDGSVRAFVRTSEGFVVERTSLDGGETWTAPTPVFGIDSTSYGTQLSVINYSETIEGKPAILLSTPSSTSGRNTGIVRVGLIQDTGAAGAQRYTIDWAYTKRVDGNLGFSYSCLTELPGGDIGLFYENYDSWATGELHTKDALALEIFNIDSLCTVE